MTNFFDIVIEVLKQDDRFFTTEGTLLRNRVYEAAMNMDGKLLKILLSNVDTKNRFFTEVEGTMVFDKVGFGWVINNRQFMPDSYTRFKNKIGLTNDNGNLISTTDDVVLTFPYKDCVLVGGQTKDDQKRDEIFYNTTLAPDEVDRLLYPKVLVDIKRYTSIGIEENITFDVSDNLIMKGNNLLAISSLLKRYEGQIKCIYIDPPYNTGSDSFNYNDAFNRSSYYTFLKNRLEIAYRLLSVDGVIWVHCDSNEFAEIKILMDEIFTDGYQTTITNCSTPNGRDYGFFAQTHDYIHIYCKNPLRLRMNKLPDEDLSKYTKKDEYGIYYLHPLFNSNSNFHKGNRPNLYYPFYVSPEANAEGYYDISLQKLPDYITLYPPLSQTDGTQFVWRWGQDLAHENLNKEIVGQKMTNGQFRIAQKMRSKDKLPRTIWVETEFSNRRGTEQLQTLFGEKAFSYPKSEELIARIIELSTDNGEMVLDFHLGSGTTAAVAHKMGRKYIGIEQMEYINNVSVERLKKVISGEQGGISKNVNWQGGGSFVYCQLAKCNQKFIDAVVAAKTDLELETLLTKVMHTGFISSKVNPAEIVENAADFLSLSIEDKKRFIIELLDKNMLYVNLCDIDDEDYGISEADKAFTKSFYEGGKK